MTVLKRRTRMVNFRLSEDEYRELKTICIANGARSISDFARTAVCKSIDGNGTPEKFESTVRELHGKFEALDREVKRLALLVEEGASAAGIRKQGPLGLAENPPTSRKGVTREKLCGSLTT